MGRKKAENTDSSVGVTPKEVQIVNEMINCELAKGEYGNYFSQNFTIGGSPKGFELEPYFRDPQGNINDIVSLARYYYTKNGLIMRVINIIRDFGISDFINYYPTSNKKAKKIIDSLNQRLNIKELMRNMIFELALTGNLACYNRDFQMVDIYPLSNIDVMPVKLNGKPLIAFKPDYMGFQDTTLDSDVLEAMKTAYPEEVINGMASSKEKILLNNDFAYFAKINSSMYERYGLPFILPAFDDIAHKNLLKEAERSTALGIIDKILLIQVGDKDTKPSTKMITEYSQKFSSMKGSIKATIPYYVDLKYIEPNSEVFGMGKYEEVDSDLLSTLGVSLSLVKGESGGSYAEGMINFTGLTRTIENIRACLPEIFVDIYKKELERNGINSEHCPSLTFKEVVIDKASKLELIQWMFQNAGLPFETVYEEAGFDYNSVKQMRETENEEDIEDIFALRAQPFQGNQGLPVEDEGGAPKKNELTRKSDPSKSNNDNPRPSDTGKNKI